MASTAVVIVDAHDEDNITNTKKGYINGLVKRSQAQGQPLFYVLPEGEDLPDVVKEGDVASIIRYDPDEDSTYDSSKIDEQITNRDIDKTQIFAVTAKGGEFSQREKTRGRSAYAGSPNASNAPDWAGRPESPGNSGK